MFVNQTQHKLEDMELVSFSVNENSCETDALLFEDAAEWIRAHPDHTLVTVALNINLEPTRTTLALFVEG